MIDRIEEYRARRALSQSIARELLRSPAHARLLMESEREPTRSQTVGSALHVAVLLPDHLADMVKVAPQVDRRTSAGRTAWNAFIESAGNSIVVTAEEYDAIRAMAESIMAHKGARDLLERCTEREVPRYWSRSGVDVKALLDATDGEIVVEVKTARDASEVGFARAIRQYSYHLQAAWYLEAIGANVFYMIVVENEPPYCTAVYRLADRAIDIGRQKMEDALALWKWCNENGTWPGYQPFGDIQEIDIVGGM